MASLLPTFWLHEEDYSLNSIGAIEVWGKHFQSRNFMKQCLILSSCILKNFSKLVSKNCCDVFEIHPSIKTKDAQTIIRSCNNSQSPKHHKWTMYLILDAWCDCRIACTWPERNISRVSNSLSHIFSHHT